jgi:hypothetical protein
MISKYMKKRNIIIIKSKKNPLLRQPYILNLKVKFAEKYMTG